MPDIIAVDLPDQRKDGEEKMPIPDDSILQRESQSGKSNGGAGSIEEKPSETAPSSNRANSGLKWFFAYSSILSTVFLFALDGTIVANLQPSIVETFRTEQNLSWIGVGFLLGNTAILPLGKAFGAFDMRWLFIASLLLFEAGSAICGAAPNMPALIIGRVIAGAGGCGIYAGGLNYVSVLTTPHERPLYLACIYSIWGVGCVLGPIVGGLFAESAATWRWGFYINLPIAAVFAPAYLLCLPSIDPLPRASFLEKIKLQDWIGIVVFLAGCTCFSMAINYGGTLYPWNSPSEIALLVMTGVLLIIFILVTIYHPHIPAEHKLVPVHFMRTRDLLILPLQSAIVAGAMYTAIYYTPLLFQFTRADGPLEGGVRILPLICTLVAAALLNAFFMPRLGYYMPWYVVGNGLVVVGGALMLTIKPDISAASIYGYTVLIGTGVGCFQSAGVAVVSTIAPPSEAIHAVSIMTIAQITGVLAALSVTGSIFQNVVIRKVSAVLTGDHFSHEDIVHLTTGTSSSLFQSLSEELQSVVISQVTDSIRLSFAYMVSISALGFILSFLLSRKKLYLENGQVANEGDGQFEKGPDG